MADFTTLISTIGGGIIHVLIETIDMAEEMPIVIMVEEMLLATQDTVQLVEEIQIAFDYQVVTDVVQVLQAHTEEVLP